LREPSIETAEISGFQDMCILDGSVHLRRSPKIFPHFRGGRHPDGFTFRLGSGNRALVLGTRIGVCWEADRILVESFGFSTCVCLVKLRSKVAPLMPLTFHSLHDPGRSCQQCPYVYLLPACRYFPVDDHPSNSRPLDLSLRNRIRRQRISCCRWRNSRRPVRNQKIGDVSSDIKFPMPRFALRENVVIVSRPMMVYSTTPFLGPVCPEGFASDFRMN
jgi:hypothetical protein